MAYPAIQVVTLGTDALFSKKKRHSYVHSHVHSSHVHSQKKRRCGLKGSSNTSTSTHTSTSSRTSTRTNTSTNSTMATMNTANANLLRNNRIPRKTSPYLGYLRHAPSRTQARARNSTQTQTSVTSTARIHATASTLLNQYSSSLPSSSLLLSSSSSSSEKFKSSPYVGFMRHAPPTNTNTNTNTNRNTKSNTKRMKMKINTNELLQMRYPDYHQYIGGPLPGGGNGSSVDGGNGNGTSTRSVGYGGYGSPLHSYYSMWKWIAAEADIASHLSFGHGHGHGHGSPNNDTTRSCSNSNSSVGVGVGVDPIATIEMFHKVASWFLFPIAYDDDETTFYYSGTSTNTNTSTDRGSASGNYTTSASTYNNSTTTINSQRRGFEFVSSVVKEFILSRGALLICTGLQMQGNPMFPLPLSSSSSSSSSIQSMTDDQSEEEFEGTHSDSHNENENGNNGGSGSGKQLDSSSLPPNHPLHISVSSLAKAYHTEQARTAEFVNLYSSEDIAVAAMSSEEIQRHLDIESILRLPTITYVSPNKVEVETMAMAKANAIRSNSDNNNNNNGDKNDGDEYGKKQAVDEKTMTSITKDILEAALTLFSHFGRKSFTEGIVLVSSLIQNHAMVRSIEDIYEIYKKKMSSSINAHDHGDSNETVFEHSAIIDGLLHMTSEIMIKQNNESGSSEKQANNDNENLIETEGKHLDLVLVPFLYYLHMIPIHLVAERLKPPFDDDNNRLIWSSLISLVESIPKASSFATFEACLAFIHKLRCNLLASIASEKLSTMEKDEEKERKCVLDTIAKLHDSLHPILLDDIDRVGPLLSSTTYRHLYPGSQPRPRQSFHRWCREAATMMGLDGVCRISSFPICPFLQFQMLLYLTMNHVKVQLIPSTFYFCKLQYLQDQYVDMC
mmetsp:Transcript_7422/g.11297  ORF Transcript_7422/g.11297 Transcript_7422/m.11297 type:complete len:899 (+) Transcript_7422:575-3271(+)